MRTLFLAVLLLATSAFAQPVVGPEATTPPLEHLGDVSLAPQRDGFVIAWEQAGRVYAGHLDATMHLTASPFQLPLFDPAAAAVLPAITSNGTSILVAWHERRPGYGEWAYIALLSADAQTLLRGPQAINLTRDAPLATAVNGKYIVYTGDLRYRYDERLEAETGDFIKHDVGAALSANGGVGTVREFASAPLSCIRFCYGYACHGPFPDCSVSATVVYSLPSKVSTAVYPFTIPANTVGSDPFASRPPVIAPNGDSFAGLVQLPNRTDISLFENIGQFTLPMVLLGDVALAGNGQDVLLVLPGATLTGMIVHADGTMSTRFPIADSGYQPRVVAIGSNAFAVLYRIDVDAAHTVLASRIVTLHAARHRATQ